MTQSVIHVAWSWKSDFFVEHMSNEHSRLAFVSGHAALLWYSAVFTSVSSIYRPLGSATTKPLCHHSFLVVNFFVGFSPEHVQLGVVCVRLSGVLGSVYTGCERQCSVNAAMTLAILLWLKTKSRSKMGCNPIWGNLSGVLKISSSVITALTLHWRWRSYKRAFNLRTDIQLHQEARISDFLLFSTGGGQRLRSWVNPWIVLF